MPAPAPVFDFDISVEDLCIQINSGKQLCVTFPGGFEVCMLVDLELGDPSKITKNLLAQVNAALTPLQPFFNVLDLAVAIVNCIEAIPSAITSLDPSKITDCLKGLKEALEKLLKLAPPVTVPLLAKQIILALAEALRGLQLELLAIIRQQERILAAATAAAKPGNVQLQAAVDCANGNLEGEIQNLNASVDPLNRLIGAVNLLLDLAKVPKDQRIPDLSELGADARAEVERLGDVVAALESLAGLIPVPG